MSTDGASPIRASHLPVPVGGLVGEKYRVDGVLGRGGMGVVVAATDLELERKVAIKFVERQDEQAVARFLREARAAARVDSEHVTRVFEVGRLEQSAPYIVMEQLEGEDLAKVIAAGPLPVSQAVGYLMQICEALAQAHAARIVHRDLKPGNLFLHRRSDGSRVVKVLDFGISKTLEGTVLTESQAIVGSPHYLAPEQIERPNKVDQRTDIWALGVVGYELISGERPFHGGSMVELCMNILSTQPPSLATKVTGVSHALDAALRRCLTKSMDARWGSVAELAEALAPFSDAEEALLLPAIQRAAARTLPTPATPVKIAMPAVGHERIEDTVDNGLEQRAARTTSKKRDAWALATVGLLLCGAVLIFLRIQGSPDPASVEAPSLLHPLSDSATTQALAPSAQAATAAPAAEALLAAPPLRPAASPTSDAATHGAESAPALPTPAPKAVRSSSAAGHREAPGAQSPKVPTSASGRSSGSEAASATATASEPLRCRVLEVVENGKRVEPAGGRVTFEWARRLCQARPSPGGAPYALSDSGISVKCACE